MTATYGRRFSIGRIVTMAYRLARLVSEYNPLQPEQLLEGTDFLELVLDSLPAEGGIAREVAFEPITLISGIWQYDLPSDVLNVEGDAWFAESGATGAVGEQLVKQAQSQAWNDRGVTGDTGTPTEYYVHRTADVPQVRLFPIPDLTGTVRFRAQRLLADSNDTSADPDLGRVWNQYLVLAVADLACASKLGEERARGLHARAKAQLEKCKAQSYEDGESTFVLELGRQF